MLKKNALVPDRTDIESGTARTDSKLHITATRLKVVEL